ncbi:MAG: hypothetical protein ABIH63_02060 [archaeon]
MVRRVKMKRMLLGFTVFALFLTAVLIIGCGGATTNAVVCNEPYILVGSSCCLDANDNNICDKDEVEEPETPPEEPEEPEPEVQTEFMLSKGESIYVFGKTFTLVEFSIFQGKLETVVDVDGVTWTIEETKKPEIVNGLVVTPVSVDKLQTYIVIDIEPFKLKTDEYLFRIDEEQVILGKVLVLKDIQDDNGVLVEALDSATNIFIMPGETKVYEGLKITNVESFYRDIRVERYALLKVSQA